MWKEGRAAIVAFDKEAVDKGTSGKLVPVFSMEGLCEAVREVGDTWSSRRCM